MITEKGHVIHVDQGSKEWLDLRLGCVTGSRVADACDFLKKGGWGSRRKAYGGQLIAERFTGEAPDVFISKPMRWGTEQEPFARNTYSFRVDNAVDKVGMVTHPTIKNALGSPDGLIGTKGGLEIKCPESHTHIQTLLSDEIDEAYMYQCQWNMDCTGREWWDFVSFDPRLFASMEIYIQRVERDDAFIETMRTHVSSLLDWVDETIEQLCEKFDVDVPITKLDQFLNEV